jgi:hypothetical protein
VVALESNVGIGYLARINAFQKPVAISACKRLCAKGETNLQVVL